jgi:hypothetical protein
LRNILPSPVTGNIFLFYAIDGKRSWGKWKIGEKAVLSQICLKQLRKALEIQGAIF